MISIGGQSQKSKTTVTPQKEMMWTPMQQNVAHNLGSTILAGMNQPVPSYPRQLYVPRTPEEQQYMQFAGAQPNEALLGQLLGRPSTTITPESAEALANAQEAAALRLWQNRIMPGLNEQFVGPGFYGSARVNALANAGADLASNLAIMRANLMYQEELARRQLAEAAANRVLPATIGTAAMLSNVGALARQIEQERVMSDFARWLSGETIDGVTPWQYNPFLQLAFNYLNYFPYQLGQQMRSSTTGSGWGFGVSWPYMYKGGSNGTG